MQIDSIAESKFQEAKKKRDHIIAEIRNRKENINKLTKEFEAIICPLSSETPEEKDDF